MEKRLYFEIPPIFIKRLYFEQAPIFYVCANILGKRQYFDNLCLIIFGAIVLKPRFKIDVVVGVI